MLAIPPHKQEHKQATIYALFLIGLFDFLSLCKNSLYILNINLLSDNVICKYFLPFLGCLSLFLIVSFDEQTL